MRLYCHPNQRDLPDLEDGLLPVLLFARSDAHERASAGAAAVDVVRRHGIVLPVRAWDLLAVALSVATADAQVTRNTSPDGWTRQLNVVIGVNDPEFWNGQSSLLASMLQFLTTDIWTFTFVHGRTRPRPPRRRCLYSAQSISLLSGGLDSLIGALDLEHQGKAPLLVSQTVHGDGDKQRRYAREIGGGLDHLQLNHNATGPWQAERSQRARSFIFLTYGVLGACALRSYRDGNDVPLYVCENGLIALNPPMTELRTGSRSTRTAHPRYLGEFQRLLRNAGFHIHVKNPYEFKTKGEMLLECSGQAYLQAHADSSTSCGRFGRYGLRHCGRCLPCIIRRAAFTAWGHTDRTEYVFDNLGIQDSDHAGFDDVRAALMGIARYEKDGIDSLLGSTLLCDAVSSPQPYKDVAGRGLREVAQFLTGLGAK